MVDMRPEHPPIAAGSVAKAAIAHGLPFNVWWAIGEASAAAIVLLALRLLGVI
jgi:hypothetical protein